MRKMNEILKNCGALLMGHCAKIHCRPAGFTPALLAAVWLLSAVPPLTVSAAAGAQLAVEKQSVAITLQKPDEEMYAVTALRFRIYVTAQAGGMEQPSFEFAGNNAEDFVRNAKVSAVEDGRYLVDVIISSKDSHDIFQNGHAAVGSLILHPSGSQAMQAVVEIAHESTADGVQPALRYVNNVSQSVQIVPMEGAEAVTVKDDGNSAPTVPVIPDKPSLPVAPGTPNMPGMPNTPILPGEPDAPAGPDKPGSSDTQKDPDDASGENGFQKTAAPELQVSAKKGARRIYFQWNEITGADGYQIYQYQADTGKYKRLKTISQGQATGYSKKMEYGAAYQFKLRAFQTKEDGGRIYGAFSTAKSITTVPSKVKGFAVKNKADGVTLSWKQTAGAQGYQIYQCAKKNGTYTRIKTIKKGTKHKYVNPSQTEGRMYYKVRAYTVGADGKRMYGAFSSVKKMQLP